MLKNTVNLFLFAASDPHAVGEAPYAIESLLESYKDGPRTVLTTT